MRRWILAIAIAAALFGVVAAPALAQNPESAPAAAPMKSTPKPKPKTPSGGTVTVTVTNSRKADLVELQAAESGLANWKQVLGALKAGQKASPTASRWMRPMGCVQCRCLRGKDSQSDRLTRHKRRIQITRSPVAVSSRSKLTLPSASRRSDRLEGSAPGSFVLIAQRNSSQSLRNLLQIDRLIMPSLVQLRSPHLMRTLVLVFAKGDRRAQS
jgi:hypothetical protein